LNRTLPLLSYNPKELARHFLLYALGKKALSAIFGPAGNAMQSVRTKTRKSLAYVTVLGERQ